MINGIVLVLFLSVIVTGQQIIRFQNAQSLKRDQEKGIFYAHFKVHHQHRLNVLPIKKTTLRTQQECGQFCADTKTCFSFNVASVTNANNKLVCELLPTDIFNKSEKFGSNPSFHHFSIKVRNCYFIVRLFFVFLCFCTFTMGSTYFDQFSNEMFLKWRKSFFSTAFFLFGNKLYWHDSVMGPSVTMSMLNSQTPCSKKPCKNGGSCVAKYEEDAFQCVCAPGYTGTYCETG